MARIRRESDKSHVEWTTRKIIEEIKDGRINFDIDIQRGYVWKDNDQKSLMIQSLILDDFVPPLYFNKIEDVYEGIDGKQKTYTIKKFIEGDFTLSGLEDIPIINDDNEPEDLDINGLKYDELPECIQNAIMEFTFTICFKINADQAEVSRNFYNLNNGTKLNAATMNRIKAKSREQIGRLSGHKLFADALSNTALEGHVNDDLVAKAHAILNDEEVSTDAKWIRPYMRHAEITNEDEQLLHDVFDRICNIHSMIEDKKIAKRIYARTHMISIVPIIVESLNDGYSDKQMMEWFVNFFCGKKSPTISRIYNEVAGRGTGKNSAIRKRLEEIKKNYDKYFMNIKSLAS